MEKIVKVREHVRGRSGITQAELSMFSGTQNYYPYMCGLKLTDGAKYLSDKAGAYWLMDIIASYQPNLQGEDFQTWKLRVNDDHTALVTCENGNGVLLKSQKIPWTDFPLTKVDVWCVNGVVMLPSEY